MTGFAIVAPVIFGFAGLGLGDRRPGRGTAFAAILRRVGPARRHRAPVVRSHAGR